MKLGDLPIVSTVFEAGADDRVFDSLLLLGPLVIGLVIVLNRPSSPRRLQPSISACS